MSREASVRRHLMALPLLGLLLASCSSRLPLDEIVAANLAARGGKEKIKALQSIRETGTATTLGGRVARVVREIKRPDLFRLEISYEGTKSVFAFDGKQSWQIAPLQGQFEPQAMPPETDPAGGADQRDIEGPLVDWRGKGHVVELVGREKLPGGEAFKLKVTLKGGKVRFDYVDVASHQIVRSDVTRVARGHKTLLENSYSDFREEGGLIFPHLVETHVQGRPQILRIVVQKIELNPALDDARFQLPR